MTETEGQPALRTRVPTGIPGLDAILHGGLVRGSVSIVQGCPGAGKTVLASQFAYAVAAGGGRVLYLTLLSESHARLLAQLSKMVFYDPRAVGSSVRYVSGFDTLERDGVDGVLRLVASEGKALDADAIVLDGLFVLEEHAGSTREFRKFVNALSLQAEVMDSTVLLLTHGARREGSAEYTMVDGWIELSRPMHEHRMVRRLQAHKLRGSDFLSGLHTLTIGDAGITVLPRFEQVAGRAAVAAAPAGAIEPTGCDGLDRMLSGGLSAGSSTLLLGPPGVGKTTLGLQFLAAGRGEPAMLLGFHETPERVQQRADALGLALRDDASGGALAIQWHPPTELELDRIGHALLDAVRGRGVRRLVLDGVDGLRQAAMEPQRLAPFLTALCNALGSEGCTTLLTMEAPQLFARQHEVRFDGVATCAGNLLLMRYDGAEGQLQRTLSIVKSRDRDFDPRTRGFTIGRGGVLVGEPNRQLRGGDATAGSVR